MIICTLDKTFKEIYIKVIKLYNLKTNVILEEKIRLCKF